MNYSTTGTDTVHACNSYTWIDGITYYSNTNSASYTLTGSNGCDSVVTLVLTIPQIDTSVSYSWPYLESAATHGALQWINCESNSITGSSDTLQVFKPKTNGIYAVQIEYQGCTDTSSCITVANVDIQETNELIDISIYPNPTRGNFIVDCGRQTLPLKITLTDMYGKIIQNISNPSSPKIPIQINGASGIYFVVIETSKNRHTYRIIKQ